MSTDYSQVYFYLAVLAIFYFLISFFAVKVGIILTIFFMLFSPEIPIVTEIWLHPIVIRLEDILIPVLCLAWLARISTEKGAHLLTRSPLNKPIGCLLGLMILSTLVGIPTGWIDPLPATMFIFKTAEFFAIFFIAMNYMSTEGQVKQFLFFMILTLTLIGIYTLFQVSSVEIFSEHRISAPFEGSPEPASVGGYMAFLLLIVFGLFIYADKIFLRWVYGIIGLIVFIPFLFTLNRTSYAALVSGMIFIGIVAKKRWITLFLVLLALTSVVWLPASVKDRLAFTSYDAKNPGRIMGVDQSFQERITAFKIVWGNCAYSPLIGRGVTSYPADNQYARTLHEIGILGLAFWIWIFVRLFKISVWLFHSMEDAFLKGMVLGYRAGLIALLFHAFGAPTFYIVRIMEPFWFVNGLVMALYLLKVRESSLAAAGGT